MEKKTALYDCHVAHGGKMVEFAGYMLPIEYPTGLMKEHVAVRNACGIFDVSHMGEIEFAGPGALEAINHLMTNDFTDFEIGACRYSTMCYEDGGVVDDLIIYRMGEQEYLVIVNAANKDKDYAWMKDHLVGDTTLTDLSAEYAQIALQGPCAETIISKLADAASLPVGYYTFRNPVEVAGIPCIVSRTGYTGEDGYELYCPWDEAPRLWNALMEAGEPYGLIPCGLGARDTLRLEASMPLYGHEMDASITPFEAKLGFCVKLDKDEFIGKETLRAKKDAKRTRIGLEAIDRGIVREEAPLYFEGKHIGNTTSGTHCPGLKKACAMALVDAGTVAIGDVVEAEVRGRTIACKVVPMPFYKIDRA